MKKTLALVLALAMVFSTITVAFAADTIGADAQICADLAMLKGPSGTVDAAYLASVPNRAQAALMVLRLRGLEAEALAFTGTANFADADKVAWAKPVMAYLKANPQLGWAGDGTNFNPAAPMTAQAYYKVMLEALGYKQTTPEVVGDFAYADVFTFAASKGLTKVAAVTNFTVNDLATATVETLKANVKDGGKTLVATLAEAGKVDKAKAVAAGLIVEAPATPAVAVDEAEAVGNAEVDVTYEDDVDASAANAALYTIEGLEVTAAGVVDSDTIRLETSAMSTGKIYKLTVGGKTVQFTAVAKVTGAPEIEKVVSEDTEEVVITFTKNVDLVAGSNVANYSIAGLEIAKAEVDGADVTLTTVGLANKTKYTVKVTNMKSVDGISKKTDSEAFTSKFDVTAPKISALSPETNERLVVTFSEKVTEATAENLANYALKVDETDGSSLEIVSVEWDSDDENFVTIVTEAMEKNEDYKLSVTGIADQRKAANTMTRPSTFSFKGQKEDEDAPRLVSAIVKSPSTILVTFSDASKVDEASATDLNNYDLENMTVEEITVVENEWKIFRALLTVEELEDDESYDLKVIGVEDEFGNVMDEDKEVVRITNDNIKAAKPIYATATGENTIVVSFDQELDEASAENIANYSIDEGLGAPTKAVYAPVNLNGDTDKTDVNGTTWNENYCVTLTVNDMINGYENDYFAPAYDLKVNGVLDLAGNKLNNSKPIDTKTNSWDTSAPKIDSVEVLNNKQVAVTFDERVKFHATGSPATIANSDTDLVLAINGVESNTITLRAKDYNEDQTVVEFAYAAGTLDESVEFSVYKIVYGGSTDGAIVDLKGTPLLVSGITRTDYEFNGTSSTDTPEAIEMDSVAQIDGMNFEITFPRRVLITTGSTHDGFTVNYQDNSDESTFNIVRLTSPTLIDEVDYTLDLSAWVTDYFGTAVADEDSTTLKTVISGEYKDTDKPYLNEVFARNRTTITIRFNESVADSTFTPADFVLKNYDLDDDMSSSISSVITGSVANDYEIRLTLSKPLEARYEYQLYLAKDKGTDIAGLGNDEDTFYFDGTNIQP